MISIATLTDGDEQCEISVSQKQFIIEDVTAWFTTSTPVKHVDLCCKSTVGLCEM